MDSSFCKETSRVCSHCSHASKVSIWLIVDTSHHPDLYEAILMETLHKVICPHCHSSEHVDAPLLLYRSDEAPHLFFSPPQETTVEEDENLLFDLTNKLRSHLGPIWQDAWLKQVQFVSQQELVGRLFEQESEHAHELEYVYEQKPDESTLKDVTAAWQRILRRPLFKRTQQEFQRMTYMKSGAYIFNLYTMKGQLEDLEMAEQYFREALRHSSVTDFLHAELLYNLGDVLTRRFQHLGELKDLKQSITYYRDATTYTPLDPFRLPACLDNLGTALYDYYSYTGDIESLNEATDVLRDAVGQASADIANLFQYMNDLGNALLARYVHIGKLEDLQEAIDFFEQVVAHVSATEPDLSGYLSNLGNALNLRFQHLRTLEDLKRAIEKHRKAVQLDSKNVYAWSGLGSDLDLYYEHTGERDESNETVTLFRGILQSTEPTSPDLPDYRANLAASLQARFLHKGRLEDLQEAIDLYQQALQLVSRQSSVRSISTEQATRGRRENFQSPVTEASGYPAYLRMLANCLLTRYNYTGRLADLREAIDIQRKAIESIPIDALHLQATYRSELGSSLVMFHDHLDDNNLLNEAIELFRYGLQHLTPEVLFFAQLQIDLGEALRQRYFVQRNLSDLQGAIAAFRKAIQLWSADAPGLAGAYNSLGNALRNSYAVTNNLQDLEEAIGAFNSAQRLDMGLSHITDIPIYLSNWGFALLDRYKRLKRQEDMQEARSVFERACQEGLNLNPKVIPETAHIWGYWEAKLGNWTGAAQAYTYAVRAAELLYRVQLLQQEKDISRSEMGSIYTRAAYAQARAERLQQATITLEQSRAKYLGEALARDRADLKHLQERDPQAFQDYQETVLELRQLEQIERNSRFSASVRDQLQKRVPLVSYEKMNRVRERLKQVVEHIRQILDFEDFLVEPTFPTIAATAMPAHPLAYIVATSWGSLILTVRHTNQNPDPLFLDAFTHEHLQTLFARKRQEGDYLIGPLARHLYVMGASGVTFIPAGPQEQLELGDYLIGPLARHLHAIGASGVTLIPVGLLGILPLHATNYREEDRTSILLNEFDVVYTPSARVLHLAIREAQRRQTENIHLLALADPTVGDLAPPLPHAEAEVKHITALLPPHTATALYADEATLEAFWKNVPQATIVHFACHGDFDIANPLNAKLLLAHEKKLTLGALLDAKRQLLTRLRLAVLSACKSAQIDSEHLPDEVIGLPAGFLQAGIPSVIGTLWTVSDRSTELLMKRFYELYLHGDPQKELAPQHPARALRLAQRWLRDLTHDELHSLTDCHSSNSMQNDGSDKEKTSTEDYKLSQQVSLDEKDYPQKSHGLRQVETLSEVQKKKAEQENRESDQTHPYTDPYYWAAFVYIGVPPENEQIVAQQK